MGEENPKKELLGKTCLGRNLIGPKDVGHGSVKSQHTCGKGQDPEKIKIL